jgi:hypothetical protein
MKCLKGLLLVRLTSIFFTANGYAVADDVSDVSDGEEEVTRITHGAPVVTTRKSLTNSGSTFASSDANLTADVLKEVTIQTAKNKLLKIKPELDLTVWESVEEVLLTNDPKSIVILLDKLVTKKVARLGTGSQREASFKMVISSIARSLSKAILSPSKKTDSMDSLNVYDEHASGSPDDYSNEY